jgi:hypothetical protein
MVTENVNTVTLTKCDTHTLQRVSSTIFPWSKVEHIVNESLFHWLGNSAASSRGGIKEFVHNFWNQIVQ